MCATFNSTKTQKSTGVSSTPSTATKEPKWLQMKRKNLSSAGKSTGPIAKKSSGSAQSPNQQTREEKRKRWAKKNRPVAKKPAAAPRGPVNEYISACCSVPARKPKAGAKEVQKDPESGKMKEKSKGLGHWRCGQCGKSTKVTPRKPEPKTLVTNIPVAPEGAVAKAIYSMPYAPYEGMEAANASA